MSMETCKSSDGCAKIVNTSGVSVPGLALYVIENWSALHDRLSSPGGGVTKFDTLIDSQTLSLVFGLNNLNVNCIVGYHTLKDLFAL